jgi:hypothetical protein
VSASALLTDGVVFELLIRLALGAVASFLAIICWTRTRTASWMCVIIGILSGYVGTLYQTLRAFGLFATPELTVFGASLGNIISVNLPLVFFIFACFLFITEKR